MGKCKVLPRHVLLAVKNDTELDILLKGVILDGGGVKPKIEPELLKNVGEEDWIDYENVIDYDITICIFCMILNFSLLCYLSS